LPWTAGSSPAVSTSSVPAAEAYAVLSATPAALRALLNGLPHSMLESTEAPGTWSPFQVLQHLVWAEVDDWLPRVRMIQSGSDEPFRPFVRDESFHRYANWPLARLLDEFGQLRAENLESVNLLSLTPEQLAAQGRHPEFGPVTLGQLVATWAAHDLSHIHQISRILTKDMGRHVGPWRKYFSLLREER